MKSIREAALAQLDAQDQGHFNGITSFCTLCDVRKRDSLTLSFMHIIGGPIEDDMKKTQIGEYVIVHPSKCDPLQRPFWVAQVLENDRKGKRLHLHWMTAPVKPKQSKKRAAAGEDEGQIEEALQLVPDDEPPRAVDTVIGDEAEQYLGSLVPVFKKTGCKIPNYGFNAFIKKFDCNNVRSNSNTGKRKDIANTAWIPYDCVYFSFPMLRGNGTLPLLILKEIASIESLGWSFPPGFQARHKNLAALNL
jgi:hypothetical protein